MAYASWLNPSKTSGSGNDTVNVGANSDNTGRNARSTNMTFKAANVADDHVLIKELFPFHPQGKIRREPAGEILVEPGAEELWETHRDSFEVGNRVHLRLLEQHPDLMVMGANLNTFSLNGTFYSVLGYSGGRSLQEALNQPGQTLRGSVERMIRLLNALEAFHCSDYLHLDISPDNIMLVGKADREQLFLIDYNSARKVGDLSGGYLSCKPGYSSPEVSTGEEDTIDFSADLYSVAAVFFRCIMGRSLTLEETLLPVPPEGSGSPLLADVPQTVSSMVSRILRKGLNTLPSKRHSGRKRQIPLHGAGHRHGSGIGEQ